MHNHDTPRPAQLWRQLSNDRKAAAVEAFWTDEHAFVEQAEAMAAIAQRIKFRLKSVQAMPLANKVRHLLAMPAVSEVIVARLLVSYHLVHQRAMMGSFLDALGIAHEDGLITDEALSAPPAGQLHAAVEKLSAIYPTEDVVLYLSTLLWQDPETWAGLADLPQLREPSPASS